MSCLSSHTSYHCLPVDCLQTGSELYTCVYISSVSLPLNKLDQILVSLRQSILCGYSDNVTFLWGMPDTPHSFGCEATDWL